MMESEGKGILGKIILASILMLLGVMITGIVADAAYVKTIPTAITSEVHNVAGTYAAGRNNTDINPAIVYSLTNKNTYGGDCPISSFVLKNSSGAAFTETTDYIVTASSGTYTLVNSATALATLPVANNNTYASYKYCGEGYVNSSWGRTVLNMTGGFIALMLIIAAAGIFYNIYQEVRE